MDAYRTRHLKVVFFVLISIGSLGCTVTPFDAPQTDEIPKGPGVFSKGDDGVVLYDSNQQSSDHRTPASIEPADKGNTEQPVPPPHGSDDAEFEAYQQFKIWKKSAAGTKEYEEFQQWRQWQQYRQWQQNQ
jgi:hypothetical protein